MSGIIISGLVMGYNAIRSDANQKVEAIPYEHSVRTTDAETDQEGYSDTISDYKLLLQNTEEEIRSLDFLTDQEKEQLIQAEKEAEPHYKKVQELGGKMDRIRQAIEDKNIQTLEEYEKLIAQTDTLWSKIMEKETQEAIHETDSRELIKRSSELSKEEKEQLLQTEDRLDELNLIIEKMYDEIDRATENLNKQLTEEYEKIDRIMQKNSSIQEKINQNMQIPNLGEDVILY